MAGPGKGAARWVGTCPVCKLTKPSVGLTAQQRMELHDRPFRVLFIDTLGPITPTDEDNRVIMHAECPFTRYAWVKAAPADTDDAWARFLVEDIFFDVCGFPGVLRSDRGRCLRESTCGSGQLVAWCDSCLW